MHGKRYRPIHRHLNQIPNTTFSYTGHDYRFAKSEKEIRRPIRSIQANEFGQINTENSTHLVLFQDKSNNSLCTNFGSEYFWFSSRNSWKNPFNVQFTRFIIILYIEYVQWSICFQLIWWVRSKYLSVELVFNLYFSRLDSTRLNRKRQAQTHKVVNARIKIVEF